MRAIIILLVLCSPAMAQGGRICTANGNYTGIDYGGVCRALTANDLGAVFPPVKSCSFNGGTVYVALSTPCPHGVTFCNVNGGDDASRVAVTGMSCPMGMMIEGFTAATYGPNATYGCLPNEERVLRSDFSIGCAREVHPQGWH